MSEAYCRPITDVTHRAYEIGLAGIAIEKIEAAIIRAIKTRKFMPCAAELRELCGEAPADSSARAFIEDCRRAEIECQRRRVENPMAPMIPHAEPKRITHQYQQRTSATLLEELEKCTGYRQDK